MALSEKGRPELVPASSRTEMKEVATHPPLPPLIPCRGALSIPPGRLGGGLEEVANEGFLEVGVSPGESSRRGTGLEDSPGGTPTSIGQESGMLEAVNDGGVLISSRAPPYRAITEGETARQSSTKSRWTIAGIRTAGFYPDRGRAPGEQGGARKRPFAASRDVKQKQDPGFKWTSSVLQVGPRFPTNVSSTRLQQEGGNARALLCSARRASALGGRQMEEGRAIALRGCSRSTDTAGRGQLARIMQMPRPSIGRERRREGDGRDDGKAMTQGSRLKTPDSFEVSLSIAR
ncbi:hypothetical protein KM043_002617 [Ampulex compressa]|nr:hypothetical protein KM043_002617 [Ampulex compressa]